VQVKAVEVGVFKYGFGLTLPENKKGGVAVPEDSDYEKMEGELLEFIGQGTVDHVNICGVIGVMMEADEVARVGGPEKAMAGLKRIVTKWL
jgi:hypothetical protein